MQTKLKWVCLTGFSAVWLCATVATAQVQPEAQNPAVDTPPPTAVQPSATQLPSAAPGAPPPAVYYPPPSYGPPPGYSPPPGYGPPPGYSPPPGYGPPPGYSPPPGYAPVYYSPKDLGPPPGSHQHDGFYMRLTGGVGYLSAKSGDGSTSMSVSGAGPAMTFAFGGSVTPHLVLYGEFVATAATDPEATYAGGSQHLPYSVNLFGIGPGLAYYLEPLNMYFSGTLAFSQVTASNTSSNSSDSANANQDWTEMGIGASFMVGKEWWVSHDWGLGVAGRLHLASMKTKQELAGTTNDRMTATAFSVLFSATYN